MLYGYNTGLIVSLQVVQRIANNNEMDYDSLQVSVRNLTKKLENEIREKKKYTFERYLLILIATLVAIIELTC